MAQILFNPPEGIDDVLNVALPDGRFIRLESGLRTFPDDGAYLLKKSVNPVIRGYLASGQIDIRMDEASGLSSVLSSATPFAPISSADLGFMPATGIATTGMGGNPNMLTTPTAGQVILPTKTPGVVQEPNPYGITSENIQLTEEGSNIAELNRMEGNRASKPESNPGSLLDSTPSLNDQPTMPVSEPTPAPIKTVAKRGRPKKSAS